MVMRFSAAALGLVLIAASGWSQTVAEQMQKAIYSQETAGDLDAAIEIYREIINSSPAERKYAAQAQYRLAQTLLQKGDLDAAAREFQMLATYPDYAEAIAVMAGRIQRASRGSVIRRGKYTTSGRGGRYVNRATSLELTVPADWTMEDCDSSDGGDMAVLTDARGQHVLVWMKAEQHPAAELADLLRHDMEVKPSMRSAGWKVRPESIQIGGTGDRQSLSAVADYTENGIKMVEHLLWVRTTRTHAFFFGKALAGAQGSLPESLARIAAAAVIP